MNLLDELGLRPDWHADAACREHPEVNYFPERGEDAKPAQQVCAGCLVKAECLDAALELGATTVGIWGGTSGRQRKPLLAGRERLTPSRSTGGACVVCTGHTVGRARYCSAACRHRAYRDRRNDAA